MSDIGPSYEWDPKHINGPRATVNLRTNSEYRALKIDSTRSFSGGFRVPISYRVECAVAFAPCWCVCV